ncbi:hypothetical protein [Carboxylicivirga linearis]|uniref:DOMON domain-containing protein n=1 Tax=Carboxylicivirga linearis TaxID=1628157 RepID=A0ABS5K213_9BACT|nr:hypothetical protein [Carboxylicivirga linearis]MBS2101181.1 hypothetical protein [Carboxylicivirga linearis]
MYRISIILILGLIAFGCNNSQPVKAPIPELMKPDWNGIDTSVLPIKFGHCLKFNLDSIQRTAIVIDFKEEGSGIWIGLCFLNNDQIFGRQIPSSIINPDCLDLLDLSYLHINALENFQIIESYDINKDKIGIGSVSPVTSLSELNRDYLLGIEQRKKPQIPYNKNLTGINVVRECYFNIEKIKN